MPALPWLNLLPGWGYGASVWDDLVPRLASRWQPWPLELPWTAPAEAWLASDGPLVSQLRPGWVMGWSLGGTLALGLRQRPEVAGVIILNATPRWCRTDDWPHGLERSEVDELAAALATDGVATTLRRFHALTTLGVHRSGPLRQTTSRHLRLDLPATQLQAGLESLVRTDLSQLRDGAPLHALWGGGDRLLPDGVHAEWIRNSCSNALSLPGAGHVILWAQPETLVSQLEVWCPKS
jgi:pimeloyl-[acyl-carrier protein] methyl ester esterase